MPVCMGVTSSWQGGLWVAFKDVLVKAPGEMQERWRTLLHHINPRRSRVMFPQEVEP